MQQSDLSQLQRQLGYVFRNDALLIQALTHSSFGEKNNERLEFLGDSLLGSIISLHLYHSQSQANEGQLSRIRAHLVRRETLAEIASDLGIANYLRLGAGERKSGGHTRESILADSFEALVAAIYLDCQQWSVLDTWLLGIFDGKLQALRKGIQFKDSKSLLQEWLQARHLALPTYQLLESHEPPLSPFFRVACHVAQLQHPIEASGNTKRQAEQHTAQLALEQLTKTES